MVRGVLLGLVKTELETHLLQAQRRFFVVDDKATQIGTSVLLIKKTLRAPPLYVVKNHATDT
jgi:hypothetical protein